ncbi:hypothetical protein [Paenibacillus sp. Soil750]|uniref:hypothetical protein n=1 Tax=Paenibacillus sp. Soil750 TaxID=1736398 RepID=UPI0006FC28FF|nr:hypothetical protein [Paenibacillus sp. Soil750]KRE70877.1 hypothetical protein ASL11_11325 [Paenibacillus sp. Soil750]
MAIEKAIQIPLEVWQDPQGDVILNVSENECNVYFGCWNDDSTPADYIAKIIFNGCWSTNYTNAEYIEYDYELLHHSYILKVIDSQLLKGMLAKHKRLYPTSKTKNDDYNHYVVAGHDVYIEVIALDFCLVRLNREQAGEYTRLIDEA